jgi:integrase/recombinase XerD
MQRLLLEVLVTNPADWDADPTTAFSQFVKGDHFVRTSSRPGRRVSKPVSTKTAAIYMFMFNDFARWLAEQRKLFSEVDTTDLVRYISQRRSEKRHNSLITVRYLRLLERCYVHLNVFPNPASQANYIASENQYVAMNKATAVLDADEITAFIKALPSITAPGGKTSGTGAAAAGWKRRRDHAMQATMLFGGLRVAEAIGLMMDEVEDSFIDMPLALKIRPEAKHDTSYEHETIVRGYGTEALRAWLAERRSMRVPGPLVFPADISGRPLPKLTVYRQVRATFQRAGIDISRAGGRTLRNTFAIEELRRGAEKPELQEKLGLALERSVETYESALTRKGTT